MSKTDGIIANSGTPGISPDFDVLVGSTYTQPVQWDKLLLDRVVGALYPQIRTSITQGVRWAVEGIVDAATAQGDSREGGTDDPSQRIIDRLSYCVGRLIGPNNPQVEDGNQESSGEGLLAGLPTLVAHELDLSGSSGVSPETRTSIGGLLEEALAPVMTEKYREEIKEVLAWAETQLGPQALAEYFREPQYSPAKAVREQNNARILKALLSEPDEYLVNGRREQLEKALQAWRLEYSDYLALKPEWPSLVEAGQAESYRPSSAEIDIFFESKFRDSLGIDLYTLDAAGKKEIIIHPEKALEPPPSIETRFNQLARLKDREELLRHRYPNLDFELRRVSFSQARILMPARHGSDTSSGHIYSKGNDLAEVQGASVEVDPDLLGTIRGAIAKPGYNRPELVFGEADDLSNKYGSYGLMVFCKQPLPRAQIRKISSETKVDCAAGLFEGICWLLAHPSANSGGEINPDIGFPRVITLADQRIYSGANIMYDPSNPYSQSTIKIGLWTEEGAPNCLMAISAA